MQTLLNVTELSYKGYKFLITEQPIKEHMPMYYKTLESHNVKMLVRVCEDMYDPSLLTSNGIEVRDMPLEDGRYPSEDTVRNFCSLVKRIRSEDEESCIAIHCVSGLGRAPVMVAVALMELGMDHLDAVELLRRQRRGVLNSAQVAFLAEYRPVGTLQPSGTVQLLKTGQELYMYFKKEST